MGWNPYNKYVGAADEKLLRATAAALKSSGLRDLGFRYVNLDAGWALKERDNKTGRVVPNPKMFDNLANGQLAKWLESEGFLFGIYSDSGTLHCGGAAPGGLGHEAIDAQTYADWGVSFLKYDNCFADDCSLPGCGHNPIPRYDAMSKALNATGKPIFFAMCEWGVANPAIWGPAVSNSWRTTADISDFWWAMCELADLTAEWFDFAGPGGWNDPDLLEVGNGGMTTAEYRSQFSIWSLMKAPLIISTDVTNMTADTLAILSAKEIIAINQDSLGVAGRLVEERPPNPAELQVWACPLSGGRVAAVFWNRGNGTASILGRFVNMQIDDGPALPGKAHVHDAWSGKDLGVASGSVTASVPEHDVVVLILTPINASTGLRIQHTAADDARWAAKWKGHGIRVPASRKASEARKKRAQQEEKQQRRLAAAAE